MRGVRRRTRANGSALALIGALAAGTALTLPGGSAALAPAPAPKLPFAAAGYAQVTTTSATLNIRVGPRGLATEYFIQYGPTTAYGYQTPTASAGNGTGEAKLAQAITGLQPGTTYHYRVVAHSSAGTTEGADAVFTTKPIPLTVTLATRPNPVVYGEPLSVFGTLTGTGNANVAVVLQADPFPYTSGFSAISVPQVTNAAGNFLFALPRLGQSATLRVALVANPNVHSHGLVEHVQLSVTLHIRPTARHGFARFYGTVAPRQAHAPVVLERLLPGRHSREYRAVSRTVVKHGPHGSSQFSRVAYLRPGTYRVLVRAYGAQISALSRSVVVR